jgi:hypothetical protein
MSRDELIAELEALQFKAHESGTGEGSAVASILAAVIGSLYCRMEVGLCDHVAGFVEMALSRLRSQ